MISNVIVRDAVFAIERANPWRAAGIEQGTCCNFAKALELDPNFSLGVTIAVAHIVAQPEHISLANSNVMGALAACPSSGGGGNGVDGDEGDDEGHTHKAK
jgi:hypothetical protein